MFSRREEEEEGEEEGEREETVPRALRLEHRFERLHSALQPSRRSVSLHSRAEDVEGLHADRDHGAGDAACVLRVVLVSRLEKRGTLEEEVEREERERRQKMASSSRHARSLSVLRSPC